MSPIVKALLESCGISEKAAHETYVLILGDDSCPRVSLDAGTTKPWRTTNKRLAEEMARDCGGRVATLADAFKLLDKQMHAINKREQN